MSSSARRGAIRETAAACRKTRCSFNRAAGVRAPLGGRGAPPSTTLTRIGLFSARRTNLVFHDLPSFHHERDAFQDCDVVERIASDSDQVRILAWVKTADAIGPVHHVRSPGGSRLNGLHRSESVLHHVEELLAVLPEGNRTGISAITNLHASLHSAAETVALFLTKHFFLGEVLFGVPIFLAMLKNEIVVVDVGNQVGTVFLH